MTTQLTISTTVVNAETLAQAVFNMKITFEIPGTKGIMFMLVIFCLKIIKQGHKLKLTFLWLLNHAYEAAFANMKLEH